jgi:hypothetical protein
MQASGITTLTLKKLVMTCAVNFYPKTIVVFLKQTTVMIALLFLCSNITAQKLTITGKVLNEKGEPVPFASVMIKGTSNGGQTNNLGEFNLIAKRIAITITCSAVGFETWEKKLDRTDFKDSIANLAIIIKAEDLKLAEVVVVGYSTRKKMHMTGSVATISASALSGKASGIMITTGDGRSFKKTSNPAFAKDDEVFKEEKKAIVVPAVKRSSLLTAGEVNDFKKWAMWTDFNESDFKMHSEKWKLFATQRYSVQLQNKDHKAITGQKVYLINRTNNDTLWTAVSDNTGKAELWNGFANAATKNDLFITVEKEAKQYAAIPFTQGINRLIINRSCSVSGRVEIAFVMDATGSMGDEINYLKEELEDVLGKIAAKDSSIDLRTGSVFYRDKGDEYVTKVQPITNGITSTINFIKQQFSGGGGDYPEAMNDALRAATENLQWSNDARTKIIFLLMDAPPHDEAKNEMAQLISNAAAKGIRIVPVACSGTDKATEFIMRSMAVATNGTYLFLTDDSGIGGSHIKPTTDDFKVELLNDLLQRVIEQMCFVNTCTEKTIGTAPFAAYVNTKNVKIFPNPTTGPVTLQTAKNLKEIYVADFTGKILMRLDVKDKKRNYNIDFSAFPSATYFIRYLTKDSIAGAEKVVVVR